MKIFWPENRTRVHHWRNRPHDLLMIWSPVLHGVSGKNQKCYDLWNKCEYYIFDCSLNVCKSNEARIKEAAMKEKKVTILWVMKRKEGSCGKCNPAIEI